MLRAATKRTAYDQMTSDRFFYISVINDQRGPTFVKEVFWSNT